MLSLSSDLNWTIFEAKCVWRTMIKIRIFRDTMCLLNKKLPLYIVGEFYQNSKKGKNPPCTSITDKLSTSGEIHAVILGWVRSRPSVSRVQPFVVLSEVLSSFGGVVLLGQAASTSFRPRFKEFSNAVSISYIHTSYFVWLIENSRYMLTPRLPVYR